jgi:hypothetical protein
VKPIRALVGGVSALLVAAAPVAAQTAAACEHSVHRKAPCRWVHGALHTTNGTPDLRIRVIGTRHILGVFDPRIYSDEGENPLPTTLQRKVDPLTQTMYADFEVCPYEKRKAGWMEFVCVAKARKVVITQDPTE